MRPWTCTEAAALKVLSPLGGKACALTFDRSLKSVERKAARLGVSLRRRSCGGRTGETNPATLRRVRELQSASLCPDCGYHYAAVRASGLCAACHMKRLRQVHEEAAAAIEAQLELWKARSRLQRRRRSLAKLQDVTGPKTGDGPTTMDRQAHSDREERA